SAIRRAKLQSYGANVLTFMIAKLSADHKAQLDLGSIWEAQECSPGLIRVFEDWALRIHAAIITGAGRSNVTEWCKKEDSWTYIRALDLRIVDSMPPEILSESEEVKESVPVGTVARSPIEHLSGEEDLINLCCGIDGKAWAQVVAWGTENGRVAPFDQ